MKKNFYLLAVFLLAILLLTGCGSEKKEETKKEEEKVCTNDYTTFLNNAQKAFMEGEYITIYRSHHEVAWSGVPEYIVELTNEGKLTVTLLDKNKTEMEIAKNVVFYKSVMTGNGGLYSLYYVDQNGKVFKADVDLAIANKEELVIKELTDVKEIVNITESGNEHGNKPLFVDINGKVLESKLLYE